MNDNGYSWPEALLTLVISIVIFGTLLPLASKMTSGMEMKKYEMHAAEAAYQGAILYQAHGLTAGTYKNEGASYDWVIEGATICVSFKPREKVAQKCIYY